MRPLASTSRLSRWALNSLVMTWPGRRTRAICAPDRTRANSTTDAVLFCPTADWAGWALHRPPGAGSAGAGLPEGAGGWPWLAQPVISAATTRLPEMQKGLFARGGAKKTKPLTMPEALWGGVSRRNTGGGRLSLQLVG